MLALLSVLLNILYKRLFKNTIYLKTMSHTNWVQTPQAFKIFTANPNVSEEFQTL